MPDEKVITEIESILSQVVELGAEKERTRLGPNLLVTNPAPTGLDNYILVRDDRDGDNILALKVPGIIYNTNDLVNVLFVRGGEAIAFQQGSGSDSSGIWGIVTGTSTDIFYNDGDVGIGKSVAPDARLELLDTAQAQLRLTHTEDTKFADLTLDTNHHLTIDPSSTGLIKLNATVSVIDEIQHEGDSDTKISFTDDVISFNSGGLNMLKLTETTQDLVEIGDVSGAGDVDINFNDDQMFLEGSSGDLGIGILLPTANLHVKNKYDVTASTDKAGILMDRLAGSAQQWLLSNGVSGVSNSYWAIRDVTGAAYRLVIDTSGNVGLSVITPSTRLDIGAGAMEFEEMTAPAAGAANTARLFAQDNGAGKTQLAVRFNTGAIQILATEP